MGRRAQKRCDSVNGGLSTRHDQRGNGRARLPASAVTCACLVREKYTVASSGTVHASAQSTTPAGVKVHTYSRRAQRQGTGKGRRGWHAWVADQGPAANRMQIARPETGARTGLHWAVGRPSPRRPPCRPSTATLWGKWPHLLARQQANSRRRMTNGTLQSCDGADPHRCGLPGWGGRLARPFPA